MNQASFSQLQPLAFLKSFNRLQESFSRDYSSMESGLRLKPLSKYPEYGYYSTMENVFESCSSQSKALDERRLQSNKEDEEFLIKNSIFMCKIINGIIKDSEEHINTLKRSNEARSVSLSQPPSRTLSLVTLRKHTRKICPPKKQPGQKQLTIRTAIEQAETHEKQEAFLQPSQPEQQSQSTGKPIFPQLKPPSKTKERFSVKTAKQIEALVHRKTDIPPERYPRRVKSPNNESLIRELVREVMNLQGRQSQRQYDFARQIEEGIQEFNGKTGRQIGKIRSMKEHRL